MTKRARWAALLLGLVFGALALAQGAVQTGTAVVTEISGQVLVRVGGNPPRPLQAGRPIPAGGVVVTGADANAVLRFADGQIVVLGERSVFRVVDFRFDPNDVGRSLVFINLIEGSARLVLGAIGQSNPGLIRIQVGLGALAGAPVGGSAASAGVVLQGATTMVTVSQGRAALSLPNGQAIVLASGQGLYVQADGVTRRGNIEQVMAQAVQTTNGGQIVEQMETLQSFALPQGNRHTVITLATPMAPLGDDPAAVAAALEALEAPGAIELATTTQVTAPTGGGGGGTPCGASCN